MDHEREQRIIDWVKAQGHSQIRTDISFLYEEYANLLAETHNLKSLAMNISTEITNLIGIVRVREKKFHDDLILFGFIILIQSAIILCYTLGII